MDPNPIKHPAVLLARLREAIEPSLAAAGFHFHSRNNPRNKYAESLWVDYTRDDTTFSFRFDHQTVSMVAEVIEPSGQVRVVANADLNMVRTDELLCLFKSFVQDVEQALTHLSA